MSRRELVVLGTASMTPTRTRTHNGYVVLFDELGVLFDPGEGTQRQMTLAGVSATDLTRIAITHLHGDHALGLAGVALRLAGEAVPHPVPVSFPASGAEQVHHLLHASVQGARADLMLQPLDAAAWSRRCPARSAARVAAPRSRHAASTTPPTRSGTASRSPTA